ncbi:outer membrane lipoprotein-sorting protein [Thermodesulfobacteriota bacterium]
MTSFFLNRKPFVLTIIFLCWGIAFVPWEVQAEMTGRQILEKVEQLHSVQDEETIVEMHLINKRGNIKKSKVRNLFMKTGDKSVKTMTFFLEPRTVRGTGLLTWTHKDKEDDQWLYFPSAEKERRISSVGKKNRFMGSDFTYEDNRPENLDTHTYTVTGSENVADHDCYIIEALPATDQEKKESGYSKRKIWIRKDIFLPVKVEFYSKRGKLIKYMVGENPEKVTETAWRSTKVTMKNIKKKHETIMFLQIQGINRGLEESLFTLKNLKSMKQGE